MKYRNVSNKTLLIPKGIDMISVGPGSEVESKIRLYNEYLLEILESKPKVYNIAEESKDASKTKSKKLR